MSPASDKDKAESEEWLLMRQLSNKDEDRRWELCEDNWQALQVFM